MPKVRSQNEIEIRKWADSFRWHFPVSSHVRIYIRPKGSVRNSQGDRCPGYFETRKTHFVIFLEYSPEWLFMLGNLVEEWAHLRCFPNNEHNLDFDLEVGKIWRFVRGKESGE